MLAWTLWALSLVSNPPIVCVCECNERGEAVGDASACADTPEYRKAEREYMRRHPWARSRKVVR